MKKIISLLTIAGSLIIQTAYAQKANIGEKCPDTKLTSIMNYKRREANLLTEFNNKPLIIDFWFIRCTPCLATILELDSLQKAYNNQFNVLLATSETEEDVNDFLSKHEKFKNLKLPIVYSAFTKSDLKKIFPHYGEPHEVWISKSGIVRAITSKYELTTDNIQKFLQDDVLNLPEKKDMFDAKYIFEQPLSKSDEENTQGKRKLYYSWFGLADPLITGGMATTINPNTKEALIRCQNIDINGLYKTAYSLYRSKGQKRGFATIKTVKQYKDSLKFEPDPKTLKNIFCYEIFMRDTSESKLRNRMQKELDDMFHLKSFIKREKVPCYVLSKLKQHNNDRFITKQKSSPHTELLDHIVTVTNVDIYIIAQRKLYNDLPYDVVNETGYEGKVDLTLPKTNDIQKLKLALNEYGLDLNLEMREENIVILQDIPE